MLLLHIVVCFFSFVVVSIHDHEYHTQRNNNNNNNNIIIIIIKNQTRLKSFWPNFILTNNNHVTQLYNCTHLVFSFMLNHNPNLFFWKSFLNYLLKGKPIQKLLITLFKHRNSYVLFVVTKQWDFKTAQIVHHK